MLKNIEIEAASNLAPPKEDELVAVMGGEPAQMLTRAIEELGGIGKFVKAGQKIVIKPNIGWAKEPEMAANTNPEIIGTLVKLCKDAGAKEILVFDHTCNEYNSYYKKNGIKKAVEDNGGKMVPANSENYYKEVSLPFGTIMKSAKIHKSIIDCDAWINVPILKHHGGAKISLSMKNSMGIIWDRQVFHKKGLQQSIADLATYNKKPVLNIIDAYRSLTQNGPQGKSIDDAVTTKALFASADPVAVDTAAVKFFGQLKTMKLEDVKHISLAEKLSLNDKKLTQIGKVRLTFEECIVKTKDEDCRACAEHYPTAALKMIPWKNGLTRPMVVHPEVCIGCGGCESICPTRKLAIYIARNEVQHMATKPKAEKQKKVDIDGFGF